MFAESCGAITSTVSKNLPSKRCVEPEKYEFLLVCKKIPSETEFSLEVKNASNKYPTTPDIQRERFMYIQYECFMIRSI